MDLLTKTTRQKVPAGTGTTWTHWLALAICNSTGKHNNFPQVVLGLATAVGPRLASACCRVQPCDSTGELHARGSLLLLCLAVRRSNNKDIWVQDHPMTVSESIATQAAAAHARVRPPIGGATLRHGPQSHFHAGLHFR